MHTPAKPPVSGTVRSFALPLLLLATACGGEGTTPRADGEGAAVRESRETGPAGPVVGTTFEEARAAGAVTLTFLHVPSSGFAYVDSGGRLTGVTVELLRDFAGFVAATHDLDVEVRWLAEERWADFYGYVRDSRGGVFGVGNVSITEARREELDFSPPYLRNVAVLVTHEDVPELPEMDRIGELFGELTALPYPGTPHEARLSALQADHLPGMSVRPVASNDELVSLLASGDGYFGYIDIYNYWRAREAGQPLRRHSVGDDGAETFGVILPHTSDWTPVMEAFFAAQGGYTSGPHFRELLRIHLGEELAALLSGATGGAARGGDEPG